MVKEVDVEFANIVFHDNYVISTIKDGISISDKHIKTLQRIFSDHFGNRHFGYISNRINNYDVNPVSSMNNPQYSTMTGIAIVCNTISKKKTAAYESIFFDIPYKIFETLDEAIVWIDTINKKAGL